MNKNYKWIAIGLVASMSACADKAPDGLDDAVDGDMPVERPRGIFVVQPNDAVPSDDEAGRTALRATARRIIFANRNGGTYTPGNDDSSRNISSIPRSTSTVGGYTWGDAAWSSFMTCLRGQFSRFNVEVTDVDPGSATHVEAVVGGRPEQLGFGSNVGGVAPMYGNCAIVERGVVYIFAGNFSSPQVQCEIAAQEIAHAYGLDHEYLCEDPMTYLSGCGKKAFQDRLVSCGEYSARACQCSSQQNSVQLLTQKLGAAGTTMPPPPPPPTGDTTAPAVSLVSPAAGAVLTGNSYLTVTARATDNVGVSRMELLWSYNNMVLPCDGSVSGVTCTRSGDQYSWRLRVGTGSRTFAARATDAAGNRATTASRTITLR